MSVPEGRTIILSQYYFMSLRDRKYNLHKIRGQREFGRGDHVQLTADNAMLFLCFFWWGKERSNLRKQQPKHLVFVHIRNDS